MFEKVQRGLQLVEQSSQMTRRRHVQKGQERSLPECTAGAGTSVWLVSVRLHSIIYYTASSTLSPLGRRALIGDDGSPRHASLSLDPPPPDSLPVHSPQ